MIYYRHDTPLDWSVLAEYLGTVESFMPIDLSTLGGQWVIACDTPEPEEGQMRQPAAKIWGAVWCFTQPPHAFIAHWAAKGPVVAVKLLICLHQFFYTNRVRYLHSMVAEDNLSSLRMAMKGMGAVAAPQHCYLYKELPYVGNNKLRDNDANNDDSRGRRPGDGDTSAAGAIG